MKIDLRKWNFFGVKKFLFMNFYVKNGCKNKFKIYYQKSCSWSRKTVHTKSIFKLYGCATSKPTAWELLYENFFIFNCRSLILTGLVRESRKSGQSQEGASVQYFLWNFSFRLIPHNLWNYQLYRFQDWKNIFIISCKNFFINEVKSIAIYLSM